MSEQLQSRQMPAVYTVSQVVAMVKGCLERTFPFIDIEAEISNFRQYSSGHAYFVLKDSGAQLNAVLFAGVPCDCRTALGDGRRVKVRGQLTMYTQRGECQFKVLRLRLAGEGELMARYLALKASLAAEGLFNMERKRHLPRFPRRIGIVTSPSGAVIHDMCRVLLRRFANIAIFIFPSLVQGAEAPASLLAALEQARARTTGPNALDLVIIARGGGSFEDLFCFNDEALVRAVAAFPVPVISAVGHETDYTLCDFAADFRAGTPSIAAEVAVPVYADILAQINNAARRIAACLRSQSDNTEQHLDRLAAALASTLSGRLASTSREIDSSVRAMASAMRFRLENALQRLATDEKALPRAAERAAERASERLSSLETHLGLLSPYSVLERGYSLTTDSNGNVVKSSADLSPGAIVSTRLAHGSFTSQITSLAVERA